MKPTLVLVHGFPLDGSMWDEVRVALDPSIPVMAPSLPGCDGGPVPPGEASLEAWAESLASFLPSSPVVMAGMSMGGYVALAFADRYPDRLAGLALVNTHPFADSEEQKAGRAALAARIREEGPSAAAEAMLGRLFRSPHGEQNARAVREAALRVGPEGLRYALAAMAARPDRSAVWSGWTKPCAVIHGAADAIVPADKARGYAATNPSGVYTELGGVGHHSPAEAPEAVAAALADLWRISAAR